MISCAFINVILVLLFTGPMAADSEIEVVTKRNDLLLIDNYGTVRNWYCIINNRTRFVLLIKRKLLKRRFHYYANCQSSFNPIVLSAFFLMCGDIHPNPGPTTNNVNSSRSDNFDSCKRPPVHKHSIVSCMYMNARSLKKNIHLQENQYISHLSRFQELLYSESVDIMFVTETWLNSNVSNTEILPNGYNIYRTDRPLGQTGGGVLIAVKHGIFISCNKVSSLSSANVEVVAIECTLPNHAKWLLVCGYRPPDSNDMSDFRSLADKLFPGYDKIIIAGDFNLPNIYWADSSYTLAGSLSQNFCDILDDYFMSQLCLVPTRESNILI